MTNYSSQFPSGMKVTFRTSGYEIADIRNSDPPPTAEGSVNGEPIFDEDGKGWLPLWCQREGREATTVYVAMSNIITPDSPTTP